MAKTINPSKLRTASKIAFAVYLAMLFVGTHLPPSSPLLPPEIHFLDKFYHFNAYAILAGLLATAWLLAAGALSFRHLCWTWIAVAVIAAFDEITQIPANRECSFGDWTADATGAAVGVLVFAWMRKVIAARVDKRRE